MITAFLQGFGFAVGASCAVLALGAVFLAAAELDCWKNARKMRRGE